MSDDIPDKTEYRWITISGFLRSHDQIMNADVRELCGVSAATANRISAGLAADKKLVKSRVAGHGDTICRHHEASMRAFLCGNRRHADAKAELIKTIEKPWRRYRARDGNS